MTTVKTPGMNVSSVTSLGVTHRIAKERARKDIRLLKLDVTHTYATTWSVLL
jgi:hypothetical protein